MRCLVWNPDFAVLGGGERFTVALGQVIAEDHDVVFAGPHPVSPARLRRLGFPAVDVVQLREQDLGRTSADYDLAVVVTLKLPPRSFATRSLLVVQFPLESVPSTRLHRARTRSKLRRYDMIVYSSFVRDWLSRRWGVDATVIHPPVELGSRAQSSKEQLILSVGRFLGKTHDQWNNKRHDALIEAFGQLPDDIRDTWRLVLVGSASPSVEIDEHLDALRTAAAGLNVTLEVNASPERLRDLQRRARLFWHASGFGRLADAPECAEHFGISTVEAMSYRAIPLVYADGGQLEIVDENCGRLWRTIPELVAKTTALVRTRINELEGLAATAREASLPFGADHFRAEVRDFLARIGATSSTRTSPPRRRRSRFRRHIVATRLHEIAARQIDRVRRLLRFRSDLGRVRKS